MMPKVELCKLKNDKEYLRELVVHNRRHAVNKMQAFFFIVIKKVKGLTAANSLTSPKISIAY